MRTTLPGDDEYVVYLTAKGDEMRRNLMNWLTGIGRQLQTLVEPDQAPLERALDLRQRDEIWECTVQRARTWITPEDRAPYRPYFILTVSRDGRVMGTELIEEEPTPYDVINGLAKAMCHPTPGSGGKRRPASIHLDDKSLTRAVASELEAIDVSCRYRRTLPEAEQALQALERFLRGGEEAIPGLLEAPGVTPFMIKGLFEAAASFYHEAPWRWIDDGNPIEMRYPVDSQPRYAVVMGHGGEAYGLAIYNSTEVLHQIYDGTPLHQVMGQEVWTAILFGKAIETPFDDLDAIEAHDWPVADDYAYPFPIPAGLSGQPSRPGKSHLLRLEAALLAIPDFLAQHVRANEGLPQPAEATLTIMMADKEDRIRLCYPVPGFEMAFEQEERFVVAALEVYERNAELLNVFEHCLRDQGLAARTIQMHLDNVERFAHNWLADEGGGLGLSCSADQAALADVDHFLADWLLYYGDQQLAQTIKSTMASLRAFYVCLKETGEMPVEDSDEILTLLREDQEYYLELAQEFER